ncbi:hypothetical protein AMJ83_03300 [candidate division WOR_3 bacterium SM23_42]|uniref:Uncharacterized protein n=1 Tax=candidate division WOR_3 bacterium SM23_42 TaxID=1703779 RepID=A0A0S8FU74_UNCW3|nr:MAG: hypothetical protein AMJ83_03300 [candidate division WOR_3 bacterium SM23_42]
MNEADFSDIARLSDKLNKDPKSRIFVQLADVYRKNNMIEEALDVLNKGLQHHSQYPVAYLILGKCYYDKRSYIQARDAFEKTIDLDPQNIVALRMLAKTSEILKDEKGQIHAYKSIVSIDPMDTTAQEKLSMLEALQRKEPLYTVAMAEEYEKQGNLKEALKIYENLLFTDPSDLVLNQRVAALKKTINEKKRRIEEEKIESLQIERVFKTEELPAEEPAEKAETPSASDTGTEEKPPTVQNDIQSLEDFLVEELEQAAEKVAAQPSEEESKPSGEEPAHEVAPTPLLDVQPEPGAPVADVTEELPEPEPPKPETMPPEIELATFEPKLEPTPAEPISAEPEPETTLPADEIREPILPETASPEREAEKPLPIGEAVEPRPTVTTSPEIEEEPVAPVEETPPPIIETTEPAEEIVPATSQEPVETTTPGVEVEPPDKAQQPEPERELEKKEEPTKSKEEDFKSFQEWLSGLLK